MLRWFNLVRPPFAEAVAARRDARVRFLQAQVAILRRKLGGNRVIASPKHRAQLLAIGRELDHDVAEVPTIWACSRGPARPEAKADVRQSSWTTH